MTLRASVPGDYDRRLGPFDRLSPVLGEPCRVGAELPTIHQQSANTADSPVELGEMSESAHSRQHSRRQLLARENRGRTEFKTYVAELAGLLKLNIADSDRLDLETTDRLFAVQVKLSQESKLQPQHCFQKTWAYEPIKVWSDVCASIGDALRGLAGVLFVGPYEYCGAIKVSPEQTLQVASPLLSFDGDTLNLGALDGCSGLCLDKFEESSEWRVELVVWGEWARLIVPVIPA